MRSSCRSFDVGSRLMQADHQPIVSGNPRRLDSGNDYDRLQRFARIATGVSAVLAVTVAVQTVFLWSLFPLKQYIPQFVTFSDKREQVVTVDTRHISRETRDLLTEGLLRGYVQDRETINDIDGGVRYPRVQRFSTNEVYQIFRARMDPNFNPKSQITEYKNNGMVRNIYIEAVVPTSYREGIYAVDYYTEDLKDGELIARKAFTATVTVIFPPTEVRAEWASENPIGLAVARYDIRPRDIAGGKNKDAKK